MSEVRYATARRPEEGAGAAEKNAYLRTLGRGLEEIGVGKGEEFAIVPLSSVDEQTKLSELDTTLGPFAKGSETSRQAALDTYPRSGSHRWRILAALQAFPDGLTREELAIATSLGGDTIRPRVLELIGGGFAVETEVTRKTQKGSDATVLLVTESGVGALAHSVGGVPQGESLEDVLARIIHPEPKGGAHASDQ